MRRHGAKNADYRGGVTCLYDTQLLGACLHAFESGGRSRPEAVRGMPDVPIAPPATGPPEGWAAVGLSAQPLSTGGCGRVCLGFWGRKESGSGLLTVSDPGLILPESACRWPQVFHTQGIRLCPMTLFNPVFNCLTPIVIKRSKTQARGGTDYSRRSWLCRSASAPSQQACEPVQDRCSGPCSRPRHAAAWRSRKRAPAGPVAWATLQACEPGPPRSEPQEDRVLLQVANQQVTDREVEQEASRDVPERRVTRHVGFDRALDHRMHDVSRKGVLTEGPKEPDLQPALVAEQHEQGIDRQREARREGLVRDVASALAHRPEAHRNPLGRLDERRRGV